MITIYGERYNEYNDGSFFLYPSIESVLCRTEEYKDLVINRELNQLDTFEALISGEAIYSVELERLIDINGLIFTIKEQSLVSEGHTLVKGVQYLAGLEAYLGYFKAENMKVDEMLIKLIDTLETTPASSTWKLIDDRSRVSTEKNSIELRYKLRNDVAMSIADLFRCEVIIDSDSRSIILMNKPGRHRGSYFHSDLNLRRVDVSSDSYDLVTRVIPYGKNNVNVSTVNGGSIYVDDNSYTRRNIVQVFKDERYTRPESLLLVARDILESFSKPLMSIKCDIINLVENSEYSFLDFRVGDRVKIIDDRIRVNDEFRIVSHTHNPDEPHLDEIFFENKPRSLSDRFVSSDVIIDEDTESNDDEIDDGCVLIDIEDIVENDDAFSDNVPLGYNALYLEEDQIDKYGYCIVIPSEIEEINIRSYLMPNPGKLKIKNLGNISGRSLFSSSRNIDISEFDSSTMTDTRNMFAGTSIVTGLNKVDTSNVTNMEDMFSGFRDSQADLSGMNTSNVTSMKRMFNSSLLTSISLDGLDTSNVTDMSWMLSSMRQLTHADLSNLNTLSLTDIEFMLYGCIKLTDIVLPNTKIFSNVIDFQMLFRECSSLVDLDLSSFDMSSIEDMSRMFMGCTSLENLTLPEITKVDRPGNTLNMIEAFKDTPNLSGSIDISGIKPQGPQETFTAYDAFLNCGASVIYVSKDLNEYAINNLRSTMVNPGNIPIVLK